MKQKSQKVMTEWWRVTNQFPAKPLEKVLTTVLGAASLSVFYSSGNIISFLFICFRNWNRWKQWRHQRQAQQQRYSASNDADSQVSADEETGDVPDGQLCVICLMRRRRSAFVPCGHLVCCQRCALSVERDLAPKCPLCRQAIHSSVRIYDS
ncbi:hypothetical protein HAX54_023564 [Datura stramonium]|uniref:RING-type domain-containing protein n=1 Tax=Datura stramonium TaxID=4076 RepID=A0ABS8Y4I8_DATST|nr:hypothetical protein [Datura stramonium]